MLGPLPPPSPLVPGLSCSASCRPSTLASLGPELIAPQPLPSGRAHLRGTTMEDLPANIPFQHHQPGLSLHTVPPAVLGAALGPSSRSTH